VLQYQLNKTPGPALLRVQVVFADISRTTTLRSSRYSVWFNDSLKGQASGALTLSRNKASTQAQESAENLLGRTLGPSKNFGGYTIRMQV
jgi:hypothetical protein